VAEPEKSETTSSPYGEALKHTVAVVCRYRNLRKWLGQQGQDPAHDLITREWRECPAITNWLTGRDGPKYRHWENQLNKIIDSAERFLEQEDEKLAWAWSDATSTEAWLKLPQSARDLYEALHAKAAERSSWGGPEVLMVHRLAIDLIKSRTGRQYQLSNITYARVRLIEQGFLTAEVGRGKNRGTTYNLLPHLFRTRQSPAGGVLSSKEAEEGLPRPKMSDQDRAVFRRTVEMLRTNQEAWDREHHKEIPAPETELFAPAEELLAAPAAVPEEHSVPTAPSAPQVSQPDVAVTEAPAPVRESMSGSKSSKALDKPMVAVSEGANA
jgi:hypothetical protein